VSRFLLLLLIVVSTAAPAVAQTTPPPPEPKLGPSNSTELGVVIATGNARSTSVGLRNVYGYRWPDALLRWESG
jgi:hypothetical protein